LRLVGKTTLITGGSRGIGKAVAHTFLREGARVAIAARKPSEIESTLGELKIACPAAIVMGRVSDVSDPEAVGTLLKEVVDGLGGIDVLVNAAGVQHPIGSLDQVSAAEWMKNVSVNLFGTMLCCHAVLPAMMARKSSKIINFSGGGATGPRPFFSAYAAAKTAVVRFTEVLAEEVRPFGIDVNSIAPGAVNTKMLDEVIEAGDKAGSKEWGDAIRRREEGGVALEVPAELVVFLASDESDGITGKLISAPWDPWRDEEFRNRLRAERDLATLRRIDDKNFYARKQ
jgi:3-oxoacyl-[acyl-carrier protein] reductase